MEKYNINEKNLKVETLLNVENFHHDFALSGKTPCTDQGVVDRSDLGA